MKRRWFKVYFDIANWEFYRTPGMLDLWIRLLCKADENGVVITTERLLSEECGVSRQQLRTMLGNLIANQQVTKSATKLATKLTICNYVSYQGSATSQQPSQQPSIQPAEPSIPISSSSKSKHYLEREKEIDTIVSTKKDDGSEEFLAFQAWILTHTPEVAKMQQPFTEAQYRSLQQNYTSREVAEVLEDMSNSANLLKKYKSAYLTCKSWLKMRRERRGGMPMAQPQRKPSKVLSMMQEMASAGIDITQPTELL